MNTKELTTLIQAATGHGLLAGHLSRWRGSLPLTCKLSREAEEASLHLWGECPALELERFLLPSMGGGRNKNPHRTILGFFKHERVRGLMEENSDWLEVLDPNDPPTQSENGEGRISLTPPKWRHLYESEQHN